MHLSEIDCNETEQTETQRADVKELLKRMPYVFASDVKDLGYANGVECKIHLTQELPYKEPCCKTLRVCIDFRKLNARTVKDSYPIP